VTHTVSDGVTFKSRDSCGSATLTIDESMFTMSMDSKTATIETFLRTGESVRTVSGDCAGGEAATGIGVHLLSCGCTTQFTRGRVSRIGYWNPDVSRAIPSSTVERNGCLSHSIAVISLLTAR
jgi:hypothetical protein